MELKDLTIRHRPGPDTGARPAPARDALAAFALVAANLAPLAGVFLLDWDTGAILLLYWTENLVIGFYNVFKMAIAGVHQPFGHLSKLFLVPFFCLHFGGFCAVHGLFLLVLIQPGGVGHDFISPARAWPGPFVFLGLLVSVINRAWASRPPGLEWPVAGLFFSHGISFIQHHLRGGEYRRLSLNELMGRPYGRIVLLHLVIIAGGVPVMMSGSPLPLLLLLVAGKTALDLGFHARSHAEPGVPRKKPPASGIPGL